ncbi:hypothetical protein BDV96DRAFT_593923 [Lophiotrema nucula]|uniref:mRNA 3'-end-processing protein RNA14 n=1 Tax=Lophiotrema nucula TaxID=690887 RepID=A0A6A5ZUT9_9PLEO|nr:hypothetical protein BDV96DRAFT_593923 [Lophiotrema nucula]
MADMDELAFLDAQKEYDPAGEFQPAPADEEEDYDPSAPLASYSAGSPSDQSASMPESAANTPQPAEADALKPQPADAAAAPTPSKQLRTKGGFVDESEDDEDEVPVSRPKAAGLLNTGVSDSPQRSHTHTPANTLAPSHVPLHSTQDEQAVSGVSSSSSHTVHDAVPTFASATPNGGTPVPDTTKTAVPVQTIVPPSYPTSSAATPTVGSSSKARLPQDRVGIFEDRIAEDPRGDIEAWLSLIEEHRRRNKFDDARAVFDRFFKVFPSAAEEWVAYANMESELGELKRTEAILGRSILQAPHIELWMTYVSHIRRINNLVTDQSGTARQVTQQVYDFVLDHAGIDVNAGKLWIDYIEFVKTYPGIVGGTSWQDTQKMDMLRKAYGRAIAVPTNSLLEIWREYDKFEMNLNKATGRKNLQEKSPFYMTARGANTQLENVTRGIIRTTLPKLPPAPGFNGYEEYMNQVQMWKNWIMWEKSDPLELKTDDLALYKKRVVYLYKQALMALRFWPELWYDAAEWCFQNDLETEGNEFLDKGIEANPESCLLAFKKANQVELTGTFEDGDVGAVRKGEAVREPYNKVLDALYGLTNTLKKREETSITQMKENFAAQLAAEEATRANDNASNDDYDGPEDEEEIAKRRQEKEDALQLQLKSISAGFNAQVTTLKKTISFAWIALMRTMRRIQGKGRPDPPPGTGPGFRGIFAEARKKGKLLSDAYVASALIEHHCYQDPAATKIFERGMKLFPDDEQFALEYCKHLVKQNDATNARAVFETIINRITGKPESVHRAKPLFLFFHEYESQFGELAQIVKLEKRMADLFPEDPQLHRFTQRFSTPTFDPTTVRPIISPKTQMRPTLPGIIPTVEEPLAVPTLPAAVVAVRQPSPGVANSPRIPNAQPHIAATNSPKRPLEDFDNELAHPRKIPRGESPLKGAAGRRLAARSGNVNQPSEQPGHPVAAQPTPLPRNVNFLLSIIPAAHTYRETRLDANKMVALLQNIDLARANLSGRPGSAAPTPVASAPPAGAFGGPPGWPPQNAYGNPHPASFPIPPQGYYGR